MPSDAHNAISLARPAPLTQRSVRAPSSRRACAEAWKAQFLAATLTTSFNVPLAVEPDKRNAGGHEVSFARDQNRAVFRLFRGFFRRTAIIRAGVKASNVDAALEFLFDQLQACLEAIEPPRQLRD